MTRIYLAGRYSRRLEFCEAADDLRIALPGVEITSRWLSGSHELDDAGLSVEAKHSERERFAREDFEDVCRSEWLIAFTEPPRSSNSRGGRHVELGIALGRGLRVLIVGPRENVFHCLGSVEYYRTWQDCVMALWSEYHRQAYGHKAVAGGTL